MTATRSRPRSRRFSAVAFAAIVLGAFAAAMAFLLLVAHRVPLYGVETDLFGDSIPAARSLLAGRLSAAEYAFKGPGYPALLALSTLATGGDAWLAARLLNLLAAIVGAGCTFLLVRRSAGDIAAAFVLAALCANPLYVRATLESGTDMPAFALCAAATWLVLSARGPGRAAVAGVLAGAAILCRYNAAFLAPAGLLALALGRERTAPWAVMAGAFAIGAALPLAPWLVLNHRMTGSAFTNRNYANLAFELYGSGMRWDRFWSELAPRFHSFADVVRYDPGAALVHWLRNLATRWTIDLRQLVPPWLGIVAVLGVLLNLRRARGGVGLLVHFAACYATLALVFYAPRFFLYLVPFYLLAAALAFFPRGGRGWSGRWPAVAAALAIAASAVVSVRETAVLLREAPVEVVEAGRILRGVARPGDGVMARKPQLAWFANMAHVPIPQVESLPQLLAAARAANARYLNFSGIEGSLLPQFRLLSEPDLHLPGLTPLARQVADPDHAFVLYRIEPAGPADTAFVDSLRSALRALGGRHPQDPAVQAYAGALLIDEGALTEALVHLDRALLLAPGMVQARVFRAAALLELGRLDEAAGDAQQAAASLARPAASLHLLLGYIRARQHRLPEASVSFEAAARAEPASVEAQLVFGIALRAQGQGDAGQAAIERAIRLAPRLASLRDTVSARAARGDAAGLERLIEQTRLAVGSLGNVESVVDLAGAAAD